MSRVGQVWWARERKINSDWEPYLVLWQCTLHYLDDGWILRALGDLTNTFKEIGVYESQFVLVEAGADDAWLGLRIA